MKLFFLLFSSCIIQAAVLCRTKWDCNQMFLFKNRCQENEGVNIAWVSSPLNLGYLRHSHADKYNSLWWSASETFIQLLLPWPMGRWRLGEGGANINVSGAHHLAQKPQDSCRDGWVMLMTSLPCAARQIRWLLWSLLVPVLAKIKVTLLLTLRLAPEGRSLLSHGILKSPCITVWMQAFPVLIWSQETAICGAAWGQRVFKGFPILWSEQGKSIPGSDCDGMGLDVSAVMTYLSFPFHLFLYFFNAK